jgi:hypothetical protein
MMVAILLTTEGWRHRPVTIEPSRRRHHLPRSNPWLSTCCATQPALSHHLLSRLALLAWLRRAIARALSRRKAPHKQDFGPASLKVAPCLGGSCLMGNDRLDSPPHRQRHPHPLDSGAATRVARCPRWCCPVGSYCRGVVNVGR